MGGQGQDSTIRSVKLEPAPPERGVGMARVWPQQRRQLEAGSAGSSRGRQKHQKQQKQNQEQKTFLHAFLSGLLGSVTQNVVSSWKQLCPQEGQGTGAAQNLSLLAAHRPVVLLAFKNSSSSDVGAVKPVAAGSAAASSEAVADSGGDEVVDFSGFGPAFIGQVFTMCDTSRRGLIAVRADSFRLSLPSFVPSFVSHFSVGWARKALGHIFKDDTEGPVFRFYFDKDEAATYVRRLNLNGSTVGSCPLDAAYRYFKGKPPMFRFVPDKKQVKAAKELLRKEQGKRAAKSFKGVPVFTARNLTIAMSTPGGVRWFTPYFFDKKQVDNLVGHSVDHYYQMLIYARHLQRHSQVDVDFPAEVAEDDPDGLLDPMEVQEFMEEMGQGAAGLESAIVKAAEVYFQDLLDVVLLGNKWSRNLAGLQPSFPVVVDSFERRAAAAETEAANASIEDGAAVEDDYRPRSSGRGEDSSVSGMDDAVGRQESGWNGRDSGKRPFRSFGKNWGFNLDGVMKRKTGEDLDMQGTKSATSSSRSEPKEADSEKSSMDHSFQPKLTMMGIAMNGPVNDLDKAMAGAAKDIEDRIRKGEGSGKEHRPLFIADLGGPLNFETTSS